ncbi:hypothetical protein [Umezawaea sp. Da 62-37]|uniref:hypothetical protein n=1 Tax=Umezawaea sp. Da 62-37 TaxID=3075927 RepID=UPI0028F6F17F|nr:hypothetical protein [Umezawaea sp. Da 62-37]WNV87790.1 hypothetical protein RM788_05765 [Umezawaea sp. Da 62-37]
MPAIAAVAGTEDHEHSAQAHSHGGITSERGNVETAAFDLVKTTVQRKGNRLVFTEQVRGRAGSVKPTLTGQFAGSSVLSYVWPLSLNPNTIGFTKDSGVLALAATSHPDFDDTPLYDENHNGVKNDDGGLWHSHWVVLVPDTTRPDGALKVRDILPDEKPDLPRRGREFRSTSTARPTPPNSTGTPSGSRYPPKTSGSRRPSPTTG